MTTGLLVNPRSGKNSGHGLKLAARLTGEKNVMVKVLEDFSQLPGYISAMAAAGVTSLFISSGDGTVQAIQTIIAEDGPFDGFPALCLLPHGTTNMTAADLGLNIRQLDRQAEFIIATGTGNNNFKTRRRATVKVTNPRDGKPRHGMFVGTGAIWQATMFTQTDIHKLGLKGDWATFATLAMALAKAAFLPARPGDKSRFDRPFPMVVRAGSQTYGDSGQTPSLFLVTTLKKLILGTRPFWGKPDHALRATIIMWPMPSVWRWTLPMLYGSEDRKMPDGCHSFSSPEMEISTDCPFIIDGEIFDPPENQPLRIETGPEFVYICGP